MVGFLERLFGRDGNSKEGTGKLAKDRLQLVLVKDRINLPTEKIQQMEREIIEVISKYVSVDLDNVDFNLSNRDRTGLLVAEIPFIAVADDDAPEDVDMAAAHDAADTPHLDDDDDTIPVPPSSQPAVLDMPPNPLLDGSDIAPHDDISSATEADDD